MKIKANQSLYRNIILAFAVLFICICTASYFLGFDVNVDSFVIYLITAFAIVLVFILLYCLIDKLNHKYIVFDDEKMIEINRDTKKVLGYYHQIAYTKYHNQIDLIGGFIDFGYVEIVFMKNATEAEAKRINLYLSKKQYAKIFHA